MKTSKGNTPVEEVQTIEGDNERYLNSRKIPPEEETDAVSALLRRVANRGSHESVSFAYQDLGENDYVDEQALHRIVEELQFGHDLRL